MAGFVRFGTAQNRRVKGDLSVLGRPKIAFLLSKTLFWNGLTDLGRILQNFSLLSYLNFCKICERSVNPFQRYMVSNLVLFGGN